MSLFTFKHFTISYVWWHILLAINRNKRIIVLSAFCKQQGKHISGLAQLSPALLVQIIYCHSVTRYDNKFGYGSSYYFIGDRFRKKYLGSRLTLAYREDQYPGGAY